MLELFDWDQCTRRCRLEHRFHEANADNMVAQPDGTGVGHRKDGTHYMDNAAVTGRRLSGDATRCECLLRDPAGAAQPAAPRVLGTVSRLYPARAPGYPYLWRNSTVCGLDGRRYSSPQVAAKASTKVINCGASASACTRPAPPTLPCC